MTGELISIFEEAKHEALLYLIQKQWDHAPDQSMARASIFANVRLRLRF
jgi:hypothetical protein